MSDNKLSRTAQVLSNTKRYNLFATGEKESIRKVETTAAAAAAAAAVRRFQICPLYL